METTVNPGAAIAREIKTTGAISFARFMELALYCPVCGYYEKEADTVGRRGDFYTSVSVGPVFGRLLAAQFAQWLEPLRTEGEQGRLHVIEAGAHRGRLLQDVIAELGRESPALREQLDFWILEPSPRAAARQQAALADVGVPVRWAASLGDLQARTAAGGIRGILFSNELLDAMPVRRFGWDAQRRRWFEWGVRLDGDQFAWTRLPHPLEDRIVTGTDLPDSLRAALADGHVLERSETAEQWWRGAAEILLEGRLLTIDYGLSTEEWLSPERVNGTLRAYRAHRVSDNLLADPGAQDLTAHVNFAAIAAAGESAGLRTEALLSQEQFLTRVLERTWPRWQKSWTRESTRQFQTLTHPEHLGRRFRVLIQHRGADPRTQQNP